MLIENNSERVKLTPDTEVRLGDVIIEEYNLYLITETPNDEYTIVNLSEGFSYEVTYKNIKALVKEQFLDSGYDCFIIRRGQMKLIIE